MSQMQRIPLHAKEVKTFKPDSLADEPVIPAFTLRAPTRQQREDMIYAMREAGLRKHSDDAMRQTSIEELCRLWECTEQDENVERMRAYWQAIDDYNSEIANLLIEAATESDDDPMPELPPFEHPDAANVEELIERLERRSERLRRMETDNIKFSRMLPRYAIAYCVTGWTGLETVPRFEDELLTVASVYDLEEELENRFASRGEAAIGELAGAAISRLFLSKDAEKNSASGPVSQQTPDVSKATGSASPNGTSPASASSAETPGA